MWTIESPMNLDEKRREELSRVRTQFLNRDDLGFFQLNRFRESVDECKKVSSFFENKNHIVVIGLGGSSLGTKAICEALWPFSWREKVTFFDNVDNYTIDHFLNSNRNFEEVGWILCSKSGSTIEVTSLFDYCASFLNPKGINIVKNSIVVTEKKASPLYDFATQSHVPVVEMPRDVGGRFSVFTGIGLLPLSFLSFDFDKAMQGFKKALDSESELLELVSALQQAIEEKTVALYTFQYCDRLLHWSLWLQQLWSESLSKSKKTNGKPAPMIPTLVPGRGASDQHSVLQQLIEGAEKQFCVIHQVASSEKGEAKISHSQFENSLMVGKSLGELLRVEAKATAQAVREAGVGTIVLSTEDLNESSMAYLMGHWMLVIGLLGELLEINAFNQPGVESGKSIARRVLSQSD